MIWEANACHSCRYVKTLEHSGLVIVKLAGLVPVGPAHWHDELRDLLGRLQRQRVLAWEYGGAHAGADRAGAEQIDANGCRRRFVGPHPHQCFQRGLRGRIGTEVSLRLIGDRRGDEHGAPGVGLPKQRLHAADELEVRRDVDGDHVVPWFQIDMAERRGGTGDAGVAYQNIELAMTFIERGTKPGDAVEISEVEWHQRGAAAILTDLVVELF